MADPWRGTHDPEALDSRDPALRLDRCAFPAWTRDAGAYLQGKWRGHSRYSGICWRCRRGRALPSFVGDGLGTGGYRVRNGGLRHEVYDRRGTAELYCDRRCVSHCHWEKTVKTLSAISRQLSAQPFSRGLI